MCDTMSDNKKTRYFIRNPESGEAWAYCGEPGDRINDAHFIMALGQFLFNEIVNDFGGADGDLLTVEIKRRDMTDEEIQALPDM